MKKLFTPDLLIQKQDLVPVLKSSRSRAKAVALLQYEERFTTAKDGKRVKRRAIASVSAHELFNMFTADIIKKETLFTR